MVGSFVYRTFRLLLINDNKSAAEFKASFTVAKQESLRDVITVFTAIHTCNELVDVLMFCEGRERMGWGGTGKLPPPMRGEGGGGGGGGGGGSHYNASHVINNDWSLIYYYKLAVVYILLINRE